MAEGTEWVDCHSGLLVQKFDVRFTMWKRRVEQAESVFWDAFEDQFADRVRGAE
jgi:hypothetical protein